MVSSGAARRKEPTAGMKVKKRRSNKSIRSGGQIGEQREARQELDYLEGAAHISFGTRSVGNVGHLERCRSAGRREIPAPQPWSGGGTAPESSLPDRAPRYSDRSGVDVAHSVEERDSETAG